MYYDRKTLKLEAKSLIREARPRAWVVTLVFILLAMALPQVIQGLLDPARQILPQIAEEMETMLRRGQEPDELWAAGAAGRMVSGGLLTMFVSVLLSLFTMVMSYGYKGYALRLFRRQQTGVGDVFSGFPLAGRAIGTEIMTFIFTFLWVLLIALVCGVVGGALSLVLDGAALGVVSTLLSLAASVLGFFVTLRYCLAPYFVMSDPDKGVFASITASKQTMRGNYLKKLVLDLSFLGWDLLLALIALVVAGVGVAVVILNWAGDWLMELGRMAQVVADEQALQAWMVGNLGELIESVTVPMNVSLVVTWLACLPLGLWLYAYQTVAEAGFFLTVTGRVVLAPDGAEPAPAAQPAPFVEVPPAPPQAPQPPMAEPPAAPAPQPPVEAPQPPVEAPQPPVEAPPAEGQSPEG